MASKEEILYFTEQLIVGTPALDPFPPATVIRWSANGYDYAALKAAGRWYTTARQKNNVLTYDQLVWILSNAETVDVAAFTKTRRVRP